MTTNFESIVGGIFRGLSNDKRSAGLTGSNVKTDNPQNYTWIGQETSDLRQPIDKEQTQNPSLPFLYKSSGTEYSYSQPLPTDITTLVSQGSPGTNIGLQHPSNLGSLVQTLPETIRFNNWQQNGYGMSPQNGDHFKGYFANQMGLLNMQATPNAANVMTAIQSQANLGADGSQNVWHDAWQTFINMRKTYNPNQQFRGS